MHPNEMISLLEDYRNKIKDLQISCENVSYFLEHLKNDINMDMTRMRNNIDKMFETIEKEK